MALLVGLKRGVAGASAPASLPPPPPIIPSAPLFPGAPQVHDPGALLMAAHRHTDTLPIGRRTCHLTAWMCSCLHVGTQTPPFLAGPP